jgi:ABC-type multidrug transport system fused ATPase/permease subunit
MIHSNIEDDELKGLGEDADADDVVVDNDDDHDHDDEGNGENGNNSIPDQIEEDLVDNDDNNNVIIAETKSHSDQQLFLSSLSSSSSSSSTISPPEIQFSERISRFRPPPPPPPPMRPKPLRHTEEETKRDNDDVERTNLDQERSRDAADEEQRTTTTTTRRRPMETDVGSDDNLIDRKDLFMKTVLREEEGNDVKENDEENNNNDSIVDDACLPTDTTPASLLPSSIDARPNVQQSNSESHNNKHINVVLPESYHPKSFRPTPTKRDAGRSDRIESTNPTSIDDAINPTVIPPPPPPPKVVPINRTNQQPHYDNRSLQNPVWHQGPPKAPQQAQHLQMQQQQQQQTQQHEPKRPTTNMNNYSRQSKNVPSSKMSLTFKRLWGKVEDALDKVASIEESVADRAQSLASTVVSNFQPITSTTTSTSSDLSSTSTAHSREERRAWMALRRQKREGNVPEPTTEALRPYGKKYDVAREKNEQKGAASIGGSSSSMNGMLLSKGGALSYRDDFVSTQQHRGREQPPPASSNTAGPNENRSAFDNVSMSQQRPPPPRNPPQEGSTSPYQGGDSRRQQNLDGQTGYYGSTIPWSQQSQQQRPPESSVRRPDSGPPPPTGPKPGEDRSFSARAKPNVPSPPRPSLDDGYSDQSPKRSFKLKWSWKVPLPPLPPNPLKLFRKKDSYKYSSLDAWVIDDDDDEDDKASRGGFLGGLFRRKQSGHAATSPSQSSSSSYTTRGSGSTDLMPLPISNILARSNNCQSTILLTEHDKQKCRRIGKFHGLTDVGILVLVVLGMRQIASLNKAFPIPASFDDFISVTLPFLSSVIEEATVSTWAPLAFLYAYLLNYVRQGILTPWKDHESLAVSASVREDSDIAQLYVMMVAALPVDATLPDRLAAVAKRQVNTVVSKARLKSYTSALAIALVVVASSIVGPMIMSCGSTFSEIVHLALWRSWPVQWIALWEQVRPLLHSLMLTLTSQIQEFITDVSTKPMTFAVPLSVLVSLAISSLLPELEQKRSIASHQSTNDDDDEEEDEIVQSVQDNDEDLQRLGMSSASRLSMLSDTNSVEGIFERWYSNRVTTEDEPSTSNHLSIKSIVRFATYVLAGFMIVVAPIFISFVLAEAGSFSLFHGAVMPRLDAPFNISFLQLYLLVLVIQAEWDVIQSTERASLVMRFLGEIGIARDEIKAANNQQTDLQAMASTSPAAGLMVRDLWAAHTTKRVWAVRGANVDCKNGEVVAILGDEAEGKSRLMTTIAESASFPPKRSLMTNKVRGTVSIGGVETSKWNRSALKRRLGVLLSDVGLVSDWASLFSGWTIGEILQPVDGLRISSSKGQKQGFVNQQHKLTRNEKSSILLALKVLSYVVPAYD